MELSSPTLKKKIRLEKISYISYFLYLPLPPLTWLRLNEQNLRQATLWDRKI